MLTQAQMIFILSKSMIVIFCKILARFLSIYESIVLPDLAGEPLQKINQVKLFFKYGVLEAHFWNDFCNQISRPALQNY